MYLKPRFFIVHFKYYRKFEYISIIVDLLISVRISNIDNYSVAQNILVQRMKMSVVIYSIIRV